MRKYRTLALGAASLALILSACSPGGSGGSPSGSAAATKPTVKVGSAAFWEAAVVGEMYAQALEAKGYTVERHLEIGERPAVHSALTSDQVNLIPEYLGGLAGQGLGIADLSSDATEAIAEHAGRPRHEGLGRVRRVAGDRFGRLCRPEGDRRRQRPDHDERSRRGGERPRLGRGRGLPGQPGLRSRPEVGVRHRPQHARGRDTAGLQHRYRHFAERRGDRRRPRSARRSPRSRR